jgi:urease accessory protein
MTSSSQTRSLALAGGAGFALSLLSGLPASAHGLAEGGWQSGFAHPLLGLDHLLLLVGVGAAASAIDASLLAFALAGAVFGSMLGLAGAALPWAEALAALAVSAVGLLLVCTLRGGTRPAAGLAGAVIMAAVAIHALLHGQEAPGPLGWWLGAGVASALVVGISSLLNRRLDARWTLGLAVLLCLAGGVLVLVPAG